MYRIILGMAIALFNGAAFADEPLAPITLSPHDYQQIMMTLMQHDPIMAMLIGKEQQAQQAAKADLKTDSKAEK